MAALDKGAKALADLRYAEKVRARAEGRAPVEVAAPPVPAGVSASDVEARYRAKLANHGKPKPAPTKEPEAKPSTKEPEAKQPAPVEKPDPEPRGDKPKGNGDRRS